MDRAEAFTHPEPPPPLAHSINATARLLGVGKTKVYELINRGELRSIHIGKRHLITDGEVRQLLQRLLAEATVTGAVGGGTVEGGAGAA